MRAVVSLVLAAAGRSSLVLLAFAPALWLAVDCGLGYHSAALAASLAYAVAGLAALGVLVRGIGAGEGRVLTTLAFVAMFFAVGGQTAWILRPYLVRPRAQSIPFVRDREGGFADALFTAGRSSMGIYDEDLSSRHDREMSEPPADLEKDTRAVEMESAVEVDTGVRARPADTVWREPTGETRGSLRDTLDDEAKVESDPKTPRRARQESER